MSKYRGNGERCCHCGITYGRFKTGLDYFDVKSWLWRESDDPNSWVYKRRGTILGKFHQHKQELWKNHQVECALQALEAEVPF